jgi:hypothetical protein
MTSELHDHDAPAGAQCAQHPEREARFTCPRCGSYACASCWQASAARCVQCVSRDPTEAVPPIPWERSGQPLVARYLATLASALRPASSAASFARDDVRAASRFLLLSALPLSLLAGVIPYTRTLLFEGNFVVRVLGHPSAAEIAIDVVRAALCAAVLTGVQLAALLFPYASLVRAYAQPQRRNAAVRVLFYRIWLLPATMLLFYFAVWALPPPALTTLQPLGLIGSVLLMWAMTSTARLACGLGAGTSIVVVLVPVLLLMLVSPLANLGAEQLLPALPATR